MIHHWILTGLISGASSGQGVQASQNRGDDAATQAMRHKKPIVRFRTKIEEDLEDALTTLEAVHPSDRVVSNKNRVRKALAMVKAISPPPSYATAIADIETSLKAVSRSTAKHQGMMNALITVAMDIQNLIAEMQRRRAEQRKRNTERILWLL